MGKKKKAELTLIFINAIDAIDDPLNKVIALDDDIETVHQYRVKIRQLRSLVAFFKPRLNEESAVEINRRLKEMASVFSHVRELDVLTDRWQSISDRQKIEEEGFLLSLIKAKKQARIEAYAIFKATQTKNDLIWIKEQTENLFSDDKKLSSFIEKRMDRWISDIRKEIKNLDIEDYPAMHQLRIQIKRLRYSLTLLSEHVDELMTERIKPSKLWAEQLGVICDYQRTKEILNELFVGDTEPKQAFLKFLENEADEIHEQLKDTKL